MLKRIATIVALFCLVSPAQAQDAQDAQARSPGAVPPPDVSEAQLGPARPNFANIGQVEAFIDGVVRSHMESDHIAGVTLSVVKDGERVLAKGYGAAGFDPPVPVEPGRTLFRIGSISKTFTWTAVMQLVEAGEIALDDPINAYLPDRLKLPADGRPPVLIRHVMTHTPGLEDLALGHLFYKDPEAVPPIDDYLVKYRPQRVRDPGVVTAYSNYASSLAGVVVAEVSGLDFETYAERNILAPLGMASTSFREPIPADTAQERGLSEPFDPALAAQMSKGFRYEAGAYQAQPVELIGAMAPAGAVSATADDMARYMLAHLGHGAGDHGRILAEATAARMQRTLFTNAEKVSGLAHGFIEYALPGGYRGFGHGGATLYFMSNMVMVPEIGLGLFISANTRSGVELVRNLPGLLVGHFFGPAAAAVSDLPAPPADFAARGQRFAGRYMTLRRAYSTIESLMGLMSLITVSVDEEGYLLVSRGGETARYVQVAPLTFRKVDGPEVVGFRENEDGAITHFLPASGIAGAERIGFFQTPDWLGLIVALMGVAGLGSLIGAWLRRRQTIRQSRFERWSARLMPAISGAWLGFIALFAAALAGLMGKGVEAMWDFPGPMLVAALSVGLLGALLTVPAALSLWPVWRDGHWPLMRRIRHTLTVAIAAAFALTLHQWNLIGFHYL